MSTSSLKIGDLLYNDNSAFIIADIRDTQFGKIYVTSAFDVNYDLCEDKPKIVNFTHDLTLKGLKVVSLYESQLSSWGYKSVNENSTVGGRPSWPETWMKVAENISSRSYDPRLKVGAVVVSGDNTRVLSLGYNGNYKGGPNVPDSDDPGKSGFIHAELNALLKSDYHYNQSKIMYVTHSPCVMCCKYIINSGINAVVYKEPYRDMSGLKLLTDSNVLTLTLPAATWIL